MKFYSIIGVFTMVLLTNCTKSEVVKDVMSFEKSEISFVSTKSNISFASQAIGIIGFKEGKLEKANEFTFILNAEQSILNGRYFDFNNIKISIRKIGLKKYEASANLNEIGLVRLSSDLLANSMILEINDKQYFDDKFFSLQNENHVGLIVISSILSDVLFDNPSPILNANKARSKCAYYAYTIGWGWTQEESIDHESCIRDGACEKIEKYKCQYLGTSTSCLWEALGCTTFSTYKCDDGKKC
ncbi:MAG: hypothetical protein ACK4UP_12300 [Spirosomataceae bacterium]